MLKDAIKTEILSARALTYRRNLLAAGAVLSLIYWYGNIDFNQLSFFGIKPSGGSPRATVLGVIWFLLLYHAAFFAYYAFRDFRTWLATALEREVGTADRNLYFPEVGMFFGRGPRLEQNQHQPEAGRRAIEWRQKIERGEVSWLPVRLLEDQGASLRGYYLRSRLVSGFRERVLWFTVVDAGALPAAAVLVPAVLSVVKG